MSEFVLRRSELLSRVDVCEGCDLVSHRFLSSLLGILDNFGDRCDVLWEAVEKLLKAYTGDLDLLRRELSLVPVDFVYKKHVEYNPYRSPQHVVSYGLEREGRLFHIGSESCPVSVLCVSASSLCEDRVVWCLYPMDLARQVGFRLVCVWSSSDSFVDSLLAWTGLDRHCASVVRCEEGVDVLWRFVHAASVRPKDRILLSIREHAPVSTSEILSQSFTGRSRVYEILRELQMESKISKVEHGKYGIV